MATFPLKIVCPEGIKFQGQIQQLNVRTTTGELGILAKHINCVAPLGMGRATIIVDGAARHAACMGGMVSVMNGQVTILPTTFEWADEIDEARAERSHDRAQNVLANKEASKTELLLAEARLKRALVRRSVAAQK
ncbi:MAG: ATP synthase F1 subunit epsilon [Oscillospiraceae bacterium]|nr:ATP synthase F1 subunit epsilon [Oscillospiraceae bacterium]